MVQKPTPGLITLRLAEADRVGLDRFPPHQQQIAVGRLDTGPHLDALEARSGRNQRLCMRDGHFERLGLARLDAQDRSFENHGQFSRRVQVDGLPISNTPRPALSLPREALAPAEPVAEYYRRTRE